MSHVTLDINQPLVDNKGNATPYFEDYLFENDDADWVAPTLLNGWVNVGANISTAGYIRLKGIIYLQGTIKNGTTTFETDLFNLPSGYRPSSRLIMNTITNGTTGRFDILSDGRVKIVSGSNVFFSVAASFVAEQ